jgi:hypothetical protein
MNAPPKKSSGHQASLFITLLLLAVYYVAVFRPLVEKERAQSGPFEAMQTRLRIAATNNPAISGLSDEVLVRMEESLRLSLTNLAQARERIAARHAPEPAVALQLAAPFRLIEYQNDLLGRGERLVALAAKQKVKLTSAVIAGLPEFTIDNPAPELLWGQLSLADGVLRAAVVAGMVSVERISMSRPLNHPAPAGAEQRLVEMPLRLEAVGGFDSIVRFLGVVLLDERGRAELKLPKVDGLPAATLQHILLRKESAKPPGTLRLTVEFRGFLQLKNGAAQ